MTHFVILDGYTLNPGDNPWNPIEQHGTVEVHDRTPPEQVVERSREADIPVTNKVTISAQAIEQLPKLKFIAVTATGCNIVDIATAGRRGISVSNVPVYGTANVAQFTWALILELCHHVGRHANSVAAGAWTKSTDFCYWLTPQIELAGKSLGLVGYGRIARQVGVIGEAFGMQILASEPTTLVGIGPLDVDRTIDCRGGHRQPASPTDAGERTNGELRAAWQNASSRILGQHIPRWSRQRV